MRFNQSGFCFCVIVVDGLGLCLIDAVLTWSKTNLFSFLCLIFLSCINAFVDFPIEIIEVGIKSWNFVSISTQLLTTKS